VDIVYMDRAGQLSQRRVRLLRVGADHVWAYCYERRAVRMFSLANILAAMPVERRKVGGHDGQGGKVARSGPARRLGF